MKKLFIAALIMVAAGTSAFALDINKENYKVRNSFETRFAGAENVSWSAAEYYIKASFTMEGEQSEAFYSIADGELIGVGRKLDLKKLPVKAMKKIKKDFADYKITDSIEFENEGEKAYYVSVDNGSKTKILQISLYGNVSVYKEGKSK